MHTHPDLDWLKSHLAFIDACSAELTEIKRLLAERQASEAKYNPRWREQPRAPRGYSDGGQWVDGGGGGVGTGPKSKTATQVPRARQFG